MSCSYDFSYTNDTDRSDLENIAEKRYLYNRSPGAVTVRNAVVMPAYSDGAVTCGGVLDENGNYVEYSRDSSFSPDDLDRYIKKHFTIYGDFFIERSAGRKTAEDAGIKSSSGICERKINVLSGNKDLPGSGEKAFRGRMPERIHETAVYLGEYRGHWGHFLTSVVSRLWYVMKRSEYKCKLVWLGGDYIFHRSEITGNFLRFFELAGVDHNDFFMPDEPVIFDELIVPEPCVSQGKWFLPEYREIFEKVKKSALPGKKAYQKLYLGRAGNEKLESSDFGERRIAEAFSDNGYHVAEPSGFTLDEQIWLISNAKTIACISGTLTHNLVFASDRTELIVLNRQGYPMLSHRLQGVINYMRQARVIHVDASIRLLPVNGAGPNIFTVTDELVKFFKDRNADVIPEQVRGHTGRRLLVLAWYFFKWLDSYGNGSEFRTARLEGQLDKRSIEIYTHFRKSMKWYDSSSGKRLKERFYHYVMKHGIF